MLSYDNNKWENLGKATGEDGVDGQDGKNGKDGKTPYLRIENGRWMLSMDNQSSWKDIGQATGERGPEGRPGTDGRNGRDGKDGEDGISPILKITDNKWYVSYNDGATWQVLGRSIGDQGEPGKTPKLIRVFGDPATLLDDRILWGYDGVPVSEWTVLCYLNELKGDSIKSVNITDAEGSLELTMESSKVITATGSVLPRFNAGTIETVEWDQNPSLVIDKTNAPREWALNVKVPKGKPATVTVVSEVEKLAPDAQPYVTDLNPDISDANLKFGIPQGEKGDPGDENIAIGCQSDFQITNQSTIRFDMILVMNPWMNIQFKTFYTILILLLVVLLHKNNLKLLENLFLIHRDLRLLIHLKVIKRMLHSLRHKVKL